MQTRGSVDGSPRDARSCRATTEEITMTRFTRQIDVPTPLDDAFAYVADFTTTAEWDPGIVEARRLDDRPLGIGSRFEVVSRFGERQLPITYTITAFDPPSRIVLEGIGARFRGTDDIRFARGADGGTRIQYIADLELRGIARAAEPLMRGRFEKVVDDGSSGLAATLRARAAT
jgi:carbon monoxide dehydrogenase subunit G